MSLLDADSEESMFRQACVYWAPSTLNDFGQPTWLAPVALPCRWKAAASTALTARTQENDTDDQVLLPSAVAKGGMLLLADLDSTMTTDARASGGREIIHVSENPDRDDESTLYVARLTG